MDNKQSAVVPFRVRSVQTGTDITENIKLKEVDVKGGTPVPFFKANDNDTFTVINADQDKDTLVDAVFKFDVEDLGQTYSLEAESKVNIKAYPKGTLEATIVTNNGRAITGIKNAQGYFDIQAKFQGQPLSNAKFQFLSRGNEFGGKATIDRQEKLSDNLTVRVFFTPTSDSRGEMVELRILRNDAVDSTKEGDAWIAAKTIMIFWPGLMLAWPSGYDRYPIGPVNSVSRLYPIVTYNGKVIKLNDPSLVLKPVNITSQSPREVGASRFSEVGRNEEYVDYKITSADPAGSGETLTFTWEVKYGSVSMDPYPKATPTLVRDQPYDAVTLNSLNSLIPNTKQKAIFSASLREGVTWMYWTPVGAKFISGKAILKVASNNTVLETIDIAGLTPDQIGRYMQEVSTKGVGQVLVITGGILGCPRGTDGKVYGVTPVACQELSIPIPEGSYDSYAMPFEKLNNKDDNYVIIGIKEQNSDTFSGATITGLKATGALERVSSPSRNPDGSFAINVIGNGSNGEVLVTADVTGPAPENRLYKYNKILKVSGFDQIVITPKDVPVKVWDVLSETPFTVTSNGTDITSQIRNLKLVPNEYIIEDPDNPGKWVVDTAPTAGATKSTFFTFEVNVSGNWKPKVGFGRYQIGAWNGVTIVASIPENLVIAGVGKEGYFDLDVKYKGKPGADKIELDNFGTRANMFQLVSQEPIENNTKLRVKVTGVNIGNGVGNGEPAINNGIPTSNFKFRLKGTTGDTNLNSVTIPEVKCFVPKDGLILYGYGGGIRGGAGEVLSGKVTYNTTTQAQTYIFLNGERIPLDSPRLEVYHEVGNDIRPPNSGLSACQFAGGSGTTIYLRITRGYPQSGAGYFNPIRFKVKNPDGTEVVWTSKDSSANFWVYPTNTSMANNVVVVPSGEVKPGVRNKLKLTFTSGGTQLTNPNVISKIIFPWPEAGNAIDMTQDYSLVKDPNDPNAYIFDFMAGTTGDRIILRGGITGSNFSGIQYYDGSIDVPKAALIAEPIDTEFNGVEGAETEMKFKVTLTGKPVTGAVISKGGIATGGSPASAKDFKEIGDGVYSVVVVGGGHEGKGFVTFFLFDGTTENQVPLEPIYGVIDSSNFKLDLTPTEISGKKGDRITLTGSLTNGETNFKFDDSSVAWSFDPADTISVVSRTADTMVVQIDKEVPYDQVVPVKVQVNSRGLKTETTISVTLTGALVVTVLEPKVDVWFSTTNPPLKFMLGNKDVTSSVNAISFVETSLVKHNGLKGGYQIISDKAIPTTKQNVSYTYKYAADTPEVNVEVPFTINEYDGKELVLTAEVPPNYRGENGEWIMYSGGFSSMQFSGKLRGVPVGALDFVSMPVGSGYCTPSGAMTYDNASGRSTMRFDFAKVGVAYTEVIVNLKLKGTPNNEIITNVNGGPARFRLTLVDSNKPFIVSDTVPGRVTGKLGDEMPMEIIAYYNDKQVALNDPKVTISKPTDPRIEIVPGSITKNGLRLRFTEDTDVTYIGNNVGLTITYMDPKNVKQTANTSFSFQHIPFYEKLEMVDGFQTSGEGTDTIVLTQAVKNPTK